MSRRFCNRPFEHIHLDPNGDVRMCSWMDVKAGNLLESDLDEIWKGEQSDEIRKSILDGSFRYCRTVSCPYLENASLPELDEEVFAEKAVVLNAPVSFNIACDFTCNHSCPSCRSRIFVGDETYKNNLNKILNSIEPYIQKAMSISACGNGDVFSSPRMMQFLENLHPEDEKCSISIETNGALFDEKHWKRIEHLGNYNLGVAVTPNSFQKTTFMYLNGGHDTYQNVMSNLNFIKGLRRKNLVKRYEISMVLQDRNFWELPDFVNCCINEFEADIVTIKPLYHWFGLSEEMFWFKDVLNPQHPYHKEYLKMMKSPILLDSRVFFWGGKNLHESKEHPAYRYKEYLNIVTKISEMSDFKRRAKQYFDENNITSIYLYGDMELSTYIYKSIKDSVKVKGFIARDFCNSEICGEKVIPLDSFDMKESEPILVLNYLYFDLVQRDFNFRKYQGKMLSLKSFIECL